MARYIRLLMKEAHAAAIAPGVNAHPVSEGLELSQDDGLDAADDDGEAGDMAHEDDAP